MNFLEKMKSLFTTRRNTKPKINTEKYELETDFNEYIKGDYLFVDDTSSQEGELQFYVEMRNEFDGSRYEILVRSSTFESSMEFAKETAVANNIEINNNVILKK
jgi:hypothetical protein